MKGDFSRITNILTAREHYSLVLMQQGRVQLDSDWNEQVLIQWFKMQELARDLIGEHGCRREHAFEIFPEANFDFRINDGRYYIEGDSYANEDNITYLNQSRLHYPSPPELEAGNKYLVYLHGWMRHITHNENGYLREVALGGPDTTTRIQNLWRVMVKNVSNQNMDELDLKTNYYQFRQLLGTEEHQRGRLKARAKQPEAEEEVCIVSPENRYRGVENQLYRVEIHSGTDLITGNAATFKWSRDNGAVVFPILEVNGESVKLAHLGRDNRLGLNVGDWVEVVDDDYELMSEVKNLLKVIAIDRETMTVTLSESAQRGSDETKHPLLRRWDHNGDKGIGGALAVETGKWMDLEDGIQIYFPVLESAVYRTRDWWWIPARTETGDIEWPGTYANPTDMEALDHGHRYAPLAIINVDANGGVTVDSDLRRKLIQLWT
jgi:hypothetical protein